jgi:hypothetical protein
MITGKGDKKATNNQLHTNDWATHKVPRMNSGVPEEWAVPAELVAPFMLHAFTKKCRSQSVRYWSVEC